MALAVAVPAVALVGILGYAVGRTTITRGKLDHLTSVRASKAYQIESYFRQIRHQAETFSEDRMIVEAMRELASGFERLEGIEAERVERDAVRAYYADEFLPRLEVQAAELPTLDDFLPVNPATVHLQYYYIAANPHPLGEKESLEAADDGTSYSAAHRRYHRILRNFLRKFGYYDLFLIDADGHIVYTVFKETDFATSLQEGPYRDSNLADAFRKALAAERADAVHLVDFAHYAPSYDAPASFIASPIYDGDKLIGVLAFQMPVGEVDRVMTGNLNWQSDGLGESGETYLVGPDFKMRSISRFILEDPDGYFDTLSEIGTPATDIERMRAFGTSILLWDSGTSPRRADWARLSSSPKW